mmetsp:Transcript_91158/g.294545  ORF Transcript_91158/g.294545 Transcript_91158/m.294545 type:complete len:265 (-) Transcript_91158:695-1489(-)
MFRRRQPPSERHVDRRRSQADFWKPAPPRSGCSPPLRRGRLCRHAPAAPASSRGLDPQAALVAVELRPAAHRRLTMIGARASVATTPSKGSGTPELPPSSAATGSRRKAACVRRNNSSIRRRRGTRQPQRRTSSWRPRVRRSSWGRLRRRCCGRISPACLRVPALRRTRTRLAESARLWTTPSSPRTVPGPPASPWPRPRTEGPSTGRARAKDDCPRPRRPRRRADPPPASTRPPLPPPPRGGLRRRVTRRNRRRLRTSGSCNA